MIRGVMTFVLGGFLVYAFVDVEYSLLPSHF
jgi:hypothetical protein